MTPLDNTPTSRSQWMRDDLKAARIPMPDPRDGLMCLGYTDDRRRLRDQYGSDPREWPHDVWETISQRTEETIIRYGTRNAYEVMWRASVDAGNTALIRLIISRLRADGYATPTILNAGGKYETALTYGGQKRLVGFSPGGADILTVRRALKTVFARTGAGNPVIALYILLHDDGEYGTRDTGTGTE